MTDRKCSGCSIGLFGEDFVVFECPNCGKAEIIRCRVCRKNGRPYTCPECGFVGP
ncbi:MAG: zinc finger domain-containing protein [Candidatus Aenigmatarchaeota archaeon]